MRHHEMKLYQRPALLLLAFMFGFAGNWTDLFRSTPEQAQRAYREGQYEKALDYFQRYLIIAQQVEIPWIIADALCFLGTAYINISPRFSERALEYHAQAVQVMEHPGGMMLGGTDWIELGNCARAVGKIDLAKDYYNNALTIPTITTNLEKPRLLAGLSQVSIAENDLDQVYEWISQAHQFAGRRKRPTQGAGLRRLRSRQPCRWRLFRLFPRSRIPGYCHRRRIRT